jgi:predicted type IV restriction endonuclease
MSEDFEAGVKAERERIIKLLIETAEGLDAMTATINTMNGEILKYFIEVESQE